jgi:hypothetical protein
MMAFTPCPQTPSLQSPLRTGRSFLAGDCLSEDGVCVGQQHHLARLKVFAKVLNQDFNDFQFTRLNNVLAQSLDSLGRIPPYS